MCKMKLFGVLAALLMLVGSLAADAPYFPTTTLAEGFFASWCVTCHDGMDGIDIVDDTAHNGELISLRYYTESPPLSSPTVDARIAHYEVFGVPVMIFNGKIRIDGGGADIADGSRYSEAFSQFRYSASPLRMTVSSWNPTTGDLSLGIETYADYAVGEGQSLYLAVVEENVDDEATHVVRHIQSIAFDHGTPGNVQTVNHSFTIDPTWVTDNLWAVAFVQKADNSILQSVSTRSLPDYNFRAAADWDMDEIVVEGGSNYESEPVWFFNLGMADSYTLQIEVIESPANWYFNYCDEGGMCLPGSVPTPMTINPDEAKGYHLNIIVGDSGIAKGNFLVTGTGLGTYRIPFRMRTSDVSASEELNSPSPLRWLSSSPNPFSGSTQLRLQSDKAMGEEWVDIYNSRGQKVDSIHLPSIQEGANSLTWQASSQLSNGVYFYRLRGSELPVSKLLLIR